MPPQVESAVESPEQLLRSLELRMAQSRAHRQRTEGQRVALLIGGLLLVVAAAAAALTIGFSMLSDLAQHEPHEAPAATAGPQP